MKNSKKGFIALPILIAIVVAILAVGGGAYVYVQNKQGSQPEVVAPIPNTISTVQNIDSQSVGAERVVSIKGYFFRKNTIDWGDIPVTCDAFVVTNVTGGDKSLIDEFIQSVKDKNTINALDEKSGNLILNLNLNNLSTTEKQKILSSIPQNTVELEIVDTRGSGRGVPACYSFVKISKVI